MYSALEYFFPILALCNLCVILILIILVLIWYQCCWLAYQSAFKALIYEKKKKQQQQL